VRGIALVLVLPDTPPSAACSSAFQGNGDQQALMLLGESDHWTKRPVGFPAFLQGILAIARWKPGWEILATASPRRVTASANMQKKPQALPAAQRFLIVEILTASLCNAACCD
jgi:hypothetical protein